MPRRPPTRNHGTSRKPAAKALKIFRARTEVGRTILQSLSEQTPLLENLGVGLSQAQALFSKNPDTKPSQPQRSSIHDRESNVGEKVDECEQEDLNFEEGYKKVINEGKAFIFFDIRT